MPLTAHLARGGWPAHLDGHSDASNNFHTKMNSTFRDLGAPRDGEINGRSVI